MGSVLMSMRVGITAKNWTTSEIKDFIETAGATVVIVRPTALGGSYSVVVPET